MMLCLRTSFYEADLQKQTKFELFVVLLHMGWKVTEKENLQCRYICKDGDGDIINKEFLVGKAKGIAQRVLVVSDFGRELSL